jgi:hypothetical protein
MDELIRHLKAASDIQFIGDITWAHAVNNILLLEQAIADKNIDFLEIDISMGGNNEPIASHDSTESNLSFSYLLSRTEGVDKGLKLDFKGQEAVIPCLNELYTAKPSQPVILNADILSVQNAPSAKIEPQWFIDACQEYYPSGLLSLGWRTNPDSTYTEDDIDAMLELCKDLKNVIFPVRASILPASWVAVKRLLEGKGRTLTIWNSEPVNAELNNWLLKHTSKQNCFYDFTISS